MFDRDRRSASGSEFFVGLLVVALLVFLLWYFLLRPRDVEVATFGAPSTVTVEAEDNLQKALEKVGGTPTAAPTATPTPRPRATPTPTPVIYTVQPGDVLSAIADRFGVLVEDIVAANDIADPDILAVGEELQIPISDE